MTNYENTTPRRNDLVMSREGIEYIVLKVETNPDVPVMVRKADEPLSAPDFIHPKDLSLI